MVDKITAVFTYILVANRGSSWGGGRVCACAESHQPEMHSYIVCPKVLVYPGSQCGMKFSALLVRGGALAIPPCNLANMKLVQHAPVGGPTDVGTMHSKTPAHRAVWGW